MQPQSVDSARRPRSRIRRYLGPGIILLASLAVSVAIERTSLFYHVDSWLTDAIHGYVAPRIRARDVLIVDINETSMAALAPQLGAWPYQRDVFALVTDHLNELGAESVIFDIIFSDEREGDHRFAAALGQGRGAWMAAQGQSFADPDPLYQGRFKRLAWPPGQPVPAANWRSIRLPNRVLTSPGRSKVGAGVVTVEPDGDGILRRVPLFHKVGNDYLPSLPLAALFSPGDTPPISMSGSIINVGPWSWPVDDEGNVQLQFPANLDMFDGLTFDVLVLSALGSEEYRLDPSAVRGRRVVIGSTAAILGDYAHVPTHGRMAGLDIVAIAYLNLANNLVLAPREKVWLVLFCILGAVIPLWVANIRSVPEWAIPLVFTAGVFTIATTHVALVGYLGRQSALLFPVLFSSFVFLGQVALRMKTLYDDRRRYFLEKLAADEANALKSQFLSHMTHELRTPLTAIMGYNKMLSDPELSDEERATQVNIIDKNCQHLLALINNLLDQAKIEAGQMSLDISSVPTKRLMDGVIDTLHPIAHQKGLELSCVFSPSVPGGVRVDELRLRQILVNLGGNAIKFTTVGGVTFSVDWKDGWLSIEVKDTGSGMTPDVLARIFEAFQQADVTVTRTHGGTGLGLSISRNLARLMGGDIDARSAPGEGSTFTVRIPAEAIEFRDRREGVMAAASADEQISGRVLVADDTEDLRHLVSLYLKKMGLDVVLAVNGKEAVELAMSERPDLVFMDMQMPVMDGLEAVRTLREKGYEGQILALTAQSDRDRIEATLNAGCDGYVEKPVSRERLREILDQRLAKRDSKSATSL
ncbi:MAG: CHASE2 domain-containing protein [Gammaproteobacteria bacterium]|nr:CHASE2 domain-containing protein [Gammaproteobacteria bacterium]